MKIEKLKPGMHLYSVGRYGMGNTTMSSVGVWGVHVVSVDVERGTVEASWNGNPVRKFYSSEWSKWREKEPLLIQSAFGAARLATRDEIKAAKAKAAAQESA